MGFNKWFAPSLDEVKQMYTDMGHTDFIKFLSRRDAFVGPPNSINFINRILKKEHEKCTTSQKSSSKHSTKNPAA